MNTTPNPLVRRREQLIALCQMQREDLAAQRHSFGQSVGGLLDPAGLLGKMGKSPLLLAGVALGFCLIRPRRLISIATTATMLWQIWQKVSPVASVFMKRRQK